VTCRLCCKHVRVCVYRRVDGDDAKPMIVSDGDAVMMTAAAAAGQPRITLTTSVCHTPSALFN